MLQALLLGLLAGRGEHRVASWEKNCKVLLEQLHSLWHKFCFLVDAVPLTQSPLCWFHSAVRFVFDLLSEPTSHSSQKESYKQVISIPDIWSCKVRLIIIIIHKQIIKKRIWTVGGEGGDIIELGLDGKEKPGTCVFRIRKSAEDRFCTSSCSILCSIAAGMGKKAEDSKL